MNAATEQEAPGSNRRQRRRQLWAAWRQHHAECLRAALLRWRRAPMASLTTILVIAVVLAIPGLLGALAYNLERLGSGLEADTGRLVLFLAPDMGQADALELRSEFAEDGLIRQARHVPPDEGLRALTDRLNLEGIDTLVDANPLPHVIELDLRLNDPGGLASLRERLTADSRVASLAHDGVWMERLQTVIRLLVQFSLAVLLLLGVAVLLVVSNTIRLELRDRHEEIRLLELMGATRSHMLRPLLYIGLVTGLAGGLGAVLIVEGMIAYLSAPVQEISSLYGTGVMLEQPVAILFGLMLLGGVLGWLGALLAGRVVIARMTLD
ncbi:MAG: cell division protein FtsX [Halothiobacillaceae bacterium]